MGCFVDPSDWYPSRNSRRKVPRTEKPRRDTRRTRTIRQMESARAPLRPVGNKTTRKGALSCRVRVQREGHTPPVFRWETLKGHSYFARLGHPAASWPCNTVLFERPLTPKEVTAKRSLAASRDGCWVLARTTRGKNIARTYLVRDSQPSPLSIAQPRPPRLGAPSKADSEKSKTQSSESAVFW